MSKKEVDLKGVDFFKEHGISPIALKDFSELPHLLGKVYQEGIIKKYGDVQGGAIGTFINVLLNALVVIAGVYAVFNLVMAGYGFMSAGDDPKKVQAAWSKIWQTLMGLAVAAGAFVLAAIFGRLLFGDYSALLEPIIPTP